MVRRVVLAFALFVAIPAIGRAQNVETDPLQCWWRTSSGAIRVGEPFTVALTCAVLETDAATVVVDQTRLEPSVVQFAPFEVLGGSHGADLRTDQRRFFQYVYRLRLIAENLFGKDVALPETKLSYRVQSKVGDKAAALQGRDQAYMLPAQSVRVMSLVPTDASDIRDTAPGETFGDLDQRAFRANLLTIVGSVLFVLAGLFALLALVRFARRFKKTTTASERLIGDSAILRGVGRELAAVRREREASGWTSDLASRALAALRVAATYALGRKTGLLPAQAQLNGNPQPEAGRIVLRAGWPRGKRIAVSGGVTSQTVTRELALAATASNPRRAAMLESLEQALTSLTAAQYGREEHLDEAALDQSLATGSQAVRRMKFEQLWVMKRLAAWRAGSALDNRAWSR
jgi:hypothetical protein